MIVITVLASIAGVQYINVAERNKASEAVQLLGVLRQAQIRYYAANASTYSTNCNNLDVEWSVPVYFAQPQCLAADPIVTVQRNANAVYGSYTLNVTADGALSCAPDAVAGACVKLGY